MQITVDTRNDSPEDIKKVIEILSDIIGMPANVKSTAPSEQTGSPLKNLFGMQTDAEEAKQQEDNTPIDPKELELELY